MSLIGVLIGLLIPSVNRSMAIASATLCKHNLREIGHALVMYQVDYDGWLPSLDRFHDGPFAIRSSEPWFAKLFPTYLSDPNILVCPKDPYGYRMRSVGSNVTDPEVAEFASYGINSFIMTSGAGAAAETERLRPSRPHHTILVADMGPDIGNSGPQVRGAGGPSRNASMLAWDDGYDPFSPQPMASPWVTMRHDHGINVMTLTGSVQEARTEQVIRTPMRRYYPECASGGCTFCRRLRVPHYSFARDSLYWWTGAVPSS